MNDTKKLRELADKARLFGACASFKEGDYHGVAIVGDKVEENFYEVMTIDTEQYEAENFALILAEFYASANPRAILSLLDRIAELEKDAARYALSKKHYDIRISRYKGKYRADNGSRVLTGWMDSYDECFDTAMKGA